MQIKPVSGDWGCTSYDPNADPDNDPNTPPPDPPLRIALYCDYDLDTGRYTEPEGGWATIHYNLSGAIPQDPTSSIIPRLRYLENVAYEVRVAAKGSNVEDPDNPGTFVPQISEFSEPVTGTPRRGRRALR